MARLSPWPVVVTRPPTGFTGLSRTAKLRRGRLSTVTTMLRTRRSGTKYFANAASPSNPSTASFAAPSLSSRPGRGLAASSFASGAG